MTLNAGENGGAPTVLDVAREADVSVATVSRVMNSPQRVRKVLRERVLRAVSALGYVPHGAAKALASNRTHTVGAVVPTIDNAIFAKYIGALQNTLHESGYSLLLASSEHSSDKELEEVNVLLRRGVDGVVLVGRDHDPLLLPLLRSRKIPFVTTWCYQQDKDLPCVGFKNLDIGNRVTTFLADLGHREFGLIAGITKNNDRISDRVLGVRETLVRRGLSLRDENYLEVPFVVGESRAATRKLLSGTKVPTAIICGNDVIAFGAVLECIALGINVPKEISITGVDDVELATHLNPPLTTIRVPSVEMGQSAGNFLLAKFAGRNCPDHHLLPLELIVRSSTGVPRMESLLRLSAATRAESAAQ